MQREEYEKFFISFMIMGIVILLIHLYYFCFNALSDIGLTSPIIDNVIATFYRGGMFEQYALSKLAALAMIALGSMQRAASTKDVSWSRTSITTVLGLAFFFVPPIDYGWLYLLTSSVGTFLCIWGFSLIRGKFFKARNPQDEEDDTFPQCEEKIENQYSINLPTKYVWEGRTRSGWINVVNPFRGTSVFGTPGSGKSFSVYMPFIEQMIAKGYTMFVYDYKYPDLTEIVYNELLNNPKGYKKLPKFYMINFNDPVHSFRCNPINARYITDTTDTTEIAELIMDNVNKGKQRGGGNSDFFSESAKLYVDALIYFLAIYDPDRGTPYEGTRKGCYCTVPHLIELMGKSYKDVFAILQDYRELKIKINNFRDALKDKAMEQLQGQIASARIPLGKFSGSPKLYWVLSGNDFTLDINNPDEPKIVCVGNDPDRQSIYGTTIALFTSRLFRLINHKGKLHSAVLLDELPTIYLKGIDNVIATARSNKVAVVLGAQDKSQIVRDYTREEANVIMNTTANFFSGQVNGETATEFAKSFGQEFRMEESESIGDTSNSVSRSYRQRDILPASRIETLSQGTFFGKVQDNIDQKIRKKFFCSEIQIDMDAYRRKHEHWHELPVGHDFGDMTDEEISEAIIQNYENIQLEVEQIVENELARIAAKEVAAMRD